MPSTFGYMWAEKGTGDIFQQGVGKNRTNLMKHNHQGHAGKPIYAPLLAKDMNVLQQLEAAKQAMSNETIADLKKAQGVIKGLGKGVNSLRNQKAAFKSQDPNYQKGTTKFDRAVLSPADQQAFDALVAKKKTMKADLDTALKQGQHFAELKTAITETRIYNAQNIGLNSFPATTHKALILGHGQAGSPFLSTEEQGGEIFELHDVASSLKKARMPSDFKDVRLTSCYSADAQKSAAPVHPLPQTSWWNIWSPRAPAQDFADALKSTGFANAEVTGYQGAGMTFPADPHHMRTFNGGATTVRAKSVKHVFKPLT